MVDNMTGYQSKKAMAQAKLEDDDDIQTYTRPWVGLTDEEFHDLQIENIDDPWANFKAIEAALRSKNT
jgi:hypothetical protein